MFRWCFTSSTTYTVDLSNVAINGPVVFTWQFLSDASLTGNDLYLDDINIFDAAADVNILNAGMQVQLFPNPASGEVNRNLHLENGRAISISITDMAGRAVNHIPFKNYRAGDTLIPLTNESGRGVYFVRLDANGCKLSTKLIIHRSVIHKMTRR